MSLKIDLEYESLRRNRMVFIQRRRDSDLKRKKLSQRLIKLEMQSWPVWLNRQNTGPETEGSQV